MEKYNFIRITNADTLKVFEAMEHVDRLNPNHWEDAGLISVDYVKQVTGIDWVNRRFIDYVSTLWVSRDGVYELKNPRIEVN